MDNHGDILGRAGSDDRACDNQVVLRGRLAAATVTRTLPSGDELCLFRLTVARPPGSRVVVDSIDCCTSVRRVRRTLERAVPGDWLEIAGSLHRRFWRSPAGPASRYEVEVHSGRCLRRRRSAA